MSQTNKSKDLAAVQRGLVALKDGATLADLQQAMLDTDPVGEESVPIPEAPAPVVLTDAAKKALRRLPDVFAEVQPTERRALSEEEMVKVHEERETLKEIVSLLAGRDEALKEIIRNHMDVAAEAEDRVAKDTPKDSSGHYILAAPQNPERVHIPNTNQDWSREYRSGKVSLDGSMLESLLDNGEISRETYLAMTQERRVFDETKTQYALAHNKDLREEIILAIKKMTRVGKPGTSLFTRKAR